jgi:hypothetical protein
VLKFICGPVVYLVNTLPFQGRDNGFESRPGYQIFLAKEFLMQLLPAASTYLDLCDER